MRILFTGGGTGGHFYPIVSVYREIKRIVEEERMLKVDLYYIGPTDFGHDILRKDAVTVVQIVSGKWRRYISYQNALDIVKVVVGTIKAFFVLFSIMPDVIFSKGGYGSIPVILVALIYRIPLMIHESDSRPGLANQLVARYASRVALSFPSAKKYFPERSTTAVVGNPIRRAIVGGSHSAAEEEFSIFLKRPVLLVMGGSQGSQIINKMTLSAIRELVNEYEIIHQAGKENFEGVKGEASVILSKSEGTYYHPYANFDDRMLRNAYAAADVIISRAGAGSIFEIAASEKPSILIPLKNSAQEHQRQNAYEYAQNGAAIIIEEDNLTPSVFLNEIRKLMGDEPRRKTMGERAKTFAKIDAAEVIARELLNLGLHK